MQLPTVQTRFLDLPGSFSLRNGAVLDKVRVAYEQYGALTPEKDNVILLFHALSGSQHAYGYNPEVPGTGSLWKPENHEGWWNSIIGPGKPLDTDRFCIISSAGQPGNRTHPSGRTVRRRPDRPQLRVPVPGTGPELHFHRLRLPGFH